MMLKLLVVDDEVDVCDFVKNFFKERNFEVFVAHNGKEALNIVKTKRPDIALMDLMMPVMDGMEALKELRKIGDLVKVIMVTAVEDIDRVEEAKRYGIIGYIVKPLLLEQLERTVFTAAEEIKMTRREGQINAV